MFSFYRLKVGIACGFLWVAVLRPGPAAAQDVKLIAHRGGVVDSTFTENGLPALEKAREEGYGMIETDLRITKDGVLIANHDPDLKRFYGFDQKVAETSWDDVRKMKSKLDGNQPLTIEEVFRFCRTNKMGVMLDNKIPGLDTLVFNRLLALLDQYHLRETALMIGTDESTDFFRNKIRLTCSRTQLEANLLRADYTPHSYFLFERPANLRREDVEWAAGKGILVVTAINKFHYRNSSDMMRDAKNDCKNMLDIGVRAFQIDSEFRKFILP